ncbi:globin [Streptomyces turgidiscabies]|uniref:Globin, protozoan/cyanobacterial family n=1 Tax=Streptomyces turgidiscabies (strain Car8) TaxID=698760 RepID=L7EXN2_STRT8|nr:MULTISPECIES: globin [Streptomyces]ELP63130.1 globin, protozoan/cyanobacterial family [Streptomyces turgidiscabies Car8]MDX3496602.1 globin [Streptomyces turgidiscabies]GAQ72799.1 bacterial-like globin [Streptomyces turgidiscabies]
MNLYQLAGGSAALHRMTRTFLAKAQTDPLLAEMFAGKDDHAEHIAGYFIMNFGGPDDYLRDRGDLRFLLRQHVGLHIAEVQRARWLELMTESAHETGMPEAFIAVFVQYLQGTSHTTVQVSNLSPDQARAMLGG